MVESSVIDQAFTDRPDLRKRTYEAIAQSPQHSSLYVDIASYITALRTPRTVTIGASDTDNNDLLPNKKRKLENDSSSGVASTHEWAPGFHVVPDTSFLVPQRKKLALEISAAPDDGLRARTPATGAVEFGFAWRDVQHAVCVPVPDKAQPQWAFCVFPAPGDGVSAPREPMVWTVMDTVPKTAVLGSEAREDETYRVLTRRALDAGLRAVGIKVVEPSEMEFVSQKVQAHRKGEKAYHVACFRGNKDGFLFFLPTGILYAFKKPLLFIEFDLIESVSYTSVLQRTFNLNIAIASSPTPGSDDRKQEFEFSMLDQADFAGIDAYVKRHGLADASMAEARRAKRLNVNGPASKNGQGGHGDGVGELQKAEEEAAANGLLDEDGEDGAKGGLREEEDDEDEEGEDYDPGSEGQSEGEGDSTSEEEGGGGGDVGGGESGQEEEEDGSDL